jgi:DNA-binding transcriptional ArsR family regulator
MMRGMSSPPERPAVPHPLPHPLALLIAERFRLLGDPMRLRILDALRDGPLTIGELARSVDSSQQNVSKHVAQLGAAGIIARTPRGTSVECSIADPTIFEMCETVCGGIERHAREQLAPFTAEGA